MLKFFYISAKYNKFIYNNASLLFALSISNKCKLLSKVKKITSSIINK